MVKKVKNIILNELPLAKALAGEVQAWADQGWQGVTQTTYELLAYGLIAGKKPMKNFIFANSARLKRLFIAMKF